MGLKFKDIISKGFLSERTMRGLGLSLMFTAFAVLSVQIIKEIVCSPTEDESGCCGSKTSDQN